MSEEEIKAIEKLKERVKIDRSLRNKVESDFDKFCEDECIAIETVLNLIGKQSSVLNKIRQLTKVIICDEDGELQKMVYADELYETFRELEVKEDE